MDSSLIKEGSVQIHKSEGTFYNPHMELSRDISSIAVNAIQLPDNQKLKICDGMSATGIRGIRYASENSNVESVTFVDMDEKSCELIKSNIKLNDLPSTGFNVITDDLNHHLYRGGERFNFIEIDPFGSPVPFIRSALLNLRASKRGIISVTATDTAVLCGAHHKACVINYGSRPLHTFFCHEAAVRILAGHVVKVASPLHLGIKPLLLLSKRHYVKGIFEVNKSAVSAFDSISNTGYASFCPKCLAIKTLHNPMISQKCEECGSIVDWGGPLWLGELHDSDLLSRMQDINAGRNYRNKTVIANLILQMRQELGMPQFYYDIHSVADHFGAMPKPFDKIISELQEKGFVVSRTHFNELAIKTNAPAKDVAAAVTGF